MTTGQFMSIEVRVRTLGTITDRTEAVKTIGLFLAELEKGSIRAATRDADGIWHVAAWVKEGILAAFKFGVLAEFASGSLSFIDKDTIPARRFKVQDGVRIVPGGSSIRRGAYVGKGVVMMPPAFVNIGAYVDEETMIDSHALVGSCAQIGKRVHLTAAAQVGGVLEPVGNLPVVTADDGVGGSASLSPAHRLDGIEISLIRQINALATADSINLGIGEPNVEPDEMLRQLARQATETSWHYSPNAGTLSLRKRLAEGAEQ